MQTTGTATFNVRSVTGDVTVDGSGDEVTLSDISGSAAVHGDFYSGSHMQHIGGAASYHSSRSDVSFTRLNGDLQIDGNDLTASEAIGPMRISTRSRNITLDRVTGDISITNNHGDVDVHVAPPTGTITVDNQNGNVNVTLPEKARFTLNAETSDGDTHSDFEAATTHGGHGMLSGSVQRRRSSRQAEHLARRHQRQPQLDRSAAAGTADPYTSAFRHRPPPRPVPTGRAALNPQPTPRSWRRTPSAKQTPS